MIVYYDLRLYEEIDDDGYLEALKKKGPEFIKRTSGFGILSLRITPEFTQPQRQVQEPQQPQQQYEEQQPETDEIPSMEELENE